MGTTNRIAWLSLALIVFSVFSLGFSGTASAAAERALEPGETRTQSYRERLRDDVEYQKVDWFQMADNLWYVGTGNVGVYLIETSDGLILIDTAQEPYVDWILDNIRATGHDPEDIEYILISHGHCDHFCGAAKISEISGARVTAMEEDWQMIEAFGNRPGRDGGPPLPVPQRDMVVDDGDTITLGDTTIQIVQTRGHTPGVLSVLFTVYDRGMPYTAFFAGGTGGRGGVDMMEAAADASARTVTYDVDMFLPNHAWNAGNPFPGGGLFERVENLADRGANDPNPFIDPEAWQQWITRAHERNLESLEAARARNPDAGGN